MTNNVNKFEKKIKELANQAKTKISDYINDSYNKFMKNILLPKEKENLKNSTKLKINDEIDKLILSFQKINGTEKIQKNIKKTEVRIETKSELNNFTSKDIQEENKEITRNFQNEALNHMNNPDEKIENENVALFLKEIARISRISYNEGKKLFEKMKGEYIKIKGGKILINNEKIRKEFSSWVKNLEKEKGRKEYENIIGQIQLFDKNDNSEEQNYLSKLFNDLTIMYFHCNLSFPLIKINFEKEDNFNSDKMIDFINIGVKDRKINFIILPSLFSNGIFLENGKSYVFTYYENTFKFEDSIIESLNKLLHEEVLLPEKKEDNLSIKVYSQIKNKEKIIEIDANNNIFEDKDYEILIHLIDKMNNKTCIIKAKEKILKIENYYDIEKYEIAKILFSSEKIYNKN